MPNTARSYDFPNAVIKIYTDGTCREFPKWCPSISVERARTYVAEALCQLRKYRKALTPSGKH